MGYNKYSNSTIENCHALIHLQYFTSLYTVNIRNSILQQFFNRGCK